MTAEKPPKPPARLSPEAKKFWNSMVEEYGVVDAAGLRLLQTACESLDLLRKAQAKVDSDGMTVRDRYGAIRGHPMLAVMRDCRASMLASLRDLRLEVEPPARGAGKPWRTA